MLEYQYFLSYCMNHTCKNTKKRRSFHVHSSLPLQDLQRLDINLLQIGKLPLPKCFIESSPDR